MNSPSTFISVAVDLLLNLTVLGASLAFGVAIAFRFIPTSLARARYLIALAAFGAASVIPILATMGLTVNEQLLRSAPLETASSIAAPADAILTVPVAPATESLLPASGSLRAWLLGFAYRLKQHTLAAVFLWLWTGVSILLFGRELIGHIGLLRARRKWQVATIELRQGLHWPSRIPLYLHPRAGPSAVGWLRPAVVLPERLLNDFSLKAINQVAQHELAHARWRDPLANALLRIIRALLWPSLPLWFLEQLAHAEREAAADQAAITDATKAESKQVALDYAASLLAIAEWEHTSALLRSFNLLGTQAGGRKALEDRVYRLLKTSPQLNPTRAALGTVALLGGLLGVSWLPVAVADQSFKVQLDRADNPLTAIAELPSREPQSLAKPQVTNRPSYPASPNKRGAINRATPIHRTDPEVAEQPTPVRSEEATKALAIKETNPPPPPNRIIVNRDGPGNATLVRQTEAGEIEEPVLHWSNAALKAAAIEKVLPSYPRGVFSYSRLITVPVFMLIDEQGNVVSAQTMRGNRDSAINQRVVEAARQWKFTPATKAGKPIKVMGTLTFIVEARSSSSFD
jgi:TonB family protein